MKILSVDDSRILRKIVGGVIESLEYEPLFAANGAEALEVLEKEWEEVSLVLLDWNMPVMDGFSCLQHILEDDRFQTIPVMMLTTESERGRIAQAVKEGARNYVTKPFTPEALVTKILECLGLGG